MKQIEQEKRTKIEEKETNAKNSQRKENDGGDKKRVEREC